MDRIIGLIVIVGIPIGLIWGIYCLVTSGNEPEPLPAFVAEDLKDKSAEYQAGYLMGYLRGRNMINESTDASNANAIATGMILGGMVGNLTVPRPMPRR